MSHCYGCDEHDAHCTCFKKIDTPKSWVGLTDEEIDNCDEVARRTFRYSQTLIRGQMCMPSDTFEWHFARAIEASLKEKNT